MNYALAHDVSLAHGASTGQAPSVGTERDETRVVATLNRGLSSRVVQTAQSMRMTTNAFVNAGMDALLEAAEGINPQAPARFVELCQRAAGFTETPVTRALMQFVMKFYPQIKELEDANRARFITRVSQYVDQHGKIPELKEMKRIQEEVNEESLLLARELRERNRATRRPARRPAV